jgi:hypothetical protein
MKKEDKLLYQYSVFNQVAQHDKWACFYLQQTCNTFKKEFDVPYCFVCEKLLKDIATLQEIVQTANRQITKQFFYHDDVHGGKATLTVCEDLENHIANHQKAKYEICPTQFQYAIYLSADYDTFVYRDLIHTTLCTVWQKMRRTINGAPIPPGSNFNIECTKILQELLEQLGAFEKTLCSLSNHQHEKTRLLLPIGIQTPIWLDRNVGIPGHLCIRKSKNFRFEPISNELIEEEQEPVKSRNPFTWLMNLFRR